MVIFDVGASFLVAGAVSMQSGGNRPELSLTAGALGIGVPGLVFLEAYPDWDWQYILDPATLPQGMTACFMAAVILAALLGHQVGRQRPRALLGALAAFLIYVLSFWHETLYVGTLAEYQAGTAPFAPAEFLQLLVVVGALAVAVIAGCLWLARQSSGSPSP